MPPWGESPDTDTTTTTTYDSPTAFPTPTQTGPAYLYQDDFSNINSGWASRNSDNNIMDYANGSYRIYVAGTYADLVANAGAYLPADVVVEVDATRNSGTEDNDYGVLCRVQDLDNFYFFQISSDGYAVIGKFENNDMAYLSADAMQKVDGILGGSGTNHIRAECIGSTLTLYANGYLLATAYDSTFSGGGDVCLMAGTFSEGGADILFDNLTVSAP